MKKLLILTILLCQFSYSFSQKYNVNNIDKSLIKNADLVFREHHTQWKVISMSDALETVDYAATLLNEDADYIADLVIPYDDFIKINSVQINIYDSNGFQIDKFKEKDMKDIGNIGSDLASDSRFKFINLSGYEYPYTIEISYSCKHKGLIGIPQWDLSETYTSIENASLSVISPKSYEFKFKEHNVEKSIDTDDEKKWEIKNIPAIEYEPLIANYESLLPVVKIAPKQFDYDGYKGSTDSWKTFGDWNLNLLNEAKSLNPKMKEEIQALVNDSMTKKEKIQTLYKYLQENTRYVSIQLGIGGFKPFDADFVHEKKYGDCKALSFYMKEMLAAIDISSHYTIIQAGKDHSEIDVDFPSTQFNHIILCVPMEKDSLWLECTSQEAPFGYLGTFTSNRHCLLISDNGGTLVKTPDYPKEGNIKNTQVNITIDYEGNAKGTINEKMYGLEFENRGFSQMISSSDKDKEDWLKHYIDTDNIDFENYDFKQLENKDYFGELDVSFSSRNFCSTMSKRMFLKPILLEKRGKFEEIENRKFDFELSQSYINTFEYIYELPTGYEVEKELKEQNIESEYGVYKISASIQDGKYIVKRHIEINKGIYSADKYNEFVAFSNQIHKADNQKIVIVKTSEP